MPAKRSRDEAQQDSSPAEQRWTGGALSLNTQQMRLLAKVARMYHERGLRQPQIAQQLHISQPRVSRLLKQAVELGVVRTVVTLPPGVHTDLEEDLQRLYGLQDAVVVETAGSSEGVIPALGAAGAAYLDVTLVGGDRIGISSWSATLLAAVDALQAKNVRVAERVVQIVGGVGSPDVQFHATRLTGRFAQLIGANPVYVPAPGLVSTTAVRRALMKDTSIGEVTAQWENLTMALVGIGSLSPSPLLRQSGNAVGYEEQEELRSLGAVGDVCLRFFDAEGKLVRSSLERRVLGISPTQLRKIPRRIAFAGGAEKYAAVRGAVLGGWANILVTDVDTAAQLVREAELQSPTKPLRLAGAVRTA